SAARSAVSADQLYTCFWHWAQKRAESLPLMSAQRAEQGEATRTLASSLAGRLARTLAPPESRVLAPLESRALASPECLAEVMLFRIGSRADAAVPSCARGVDSRHSTENLWMVVEGTTYPL